MNDAYLGPHQFYKNDIKQTAKRYQANYNHYSDFNLLAHETAELIAKGKVMDF
jgi:hypothetical protein